MEEGKEGHGKKRGGWRRGMRRDGRSAKKENERKLYNAQDDHGGI